MNQRPKTLGLAHLKKKKKKNSHQIHSSGEATHLSPIDAPWAAWRVEDGGRDMLNFGQFREVPTVEKKLCPENSSSHISSPLSPPSLVFPLIGLTQSTQYLAVARISGFIASGVGDMILWHLWLLSGPCHDRFCFSSPKGDIFFFENALRALKQLFFTGM